MDTRNADTKTKSQEESLNRAFKSCQFSHAPRSVLGDKIYYYPPYYHSRGFMEITCFSLMSHHPPIYATCDVVVCWTASQ